MPSDSPMIPFDDALRIAMEQVRPTGTERVPLAGAAGRILAEDVVADHDVPPFDKRAPRPGSASAPGRAPGS